MTHRPVSSHPPLVIQYLDDSGDLQVAVPPGLAKDPHWDRYGDSFLQALMDTLADIAGEDDPDMDDGGR